jgi:hypothetical protein
MSWFLPAPAPPQCGDDDDDGGGDDDDDDAPMVIPVARCD